jgi:hypothetical protein
MQILFRLNTVSDEIGVQNMGKNILCFDDSTGFCSSTPFDAWSSPPVASSTDIAAALAESG